MSFFQDIAEYHEFFMTGSWERLAPRLDAGLDAPERVVEIGAGSGLGTLAMSRLWPQARFICVEPDSSMRAILMGRLTADAELRERVEVLLFAVGPETLDRLRELLAGEADLVVVAHLMGILDPDERAALFEVARAALAGSGRLAITMGQPHADDDGADHDTPQVRSVAVGRQRVEEEWRPGRVVYRHYDHRGGLLAEVAAAGFERLAEDEAGLILFRPNAR